MAPSSLPSPGYDLHLKLPKEVHQQMRKLQSQAGLENLAEVIKHAIALYDLSLEHRAESGKIIFRHSDGTEEELTKI